MFDFIKENPFFCLIIFLLIVAPSFLFGAVQVIAIIIFVIFIIALVGVNILRWKLRKIQREGFQEGESGASARGSWSTGGTRGTRGTRGTGGGTKRGRKSADNVKIFTTSSGSATEKKVSNDVGDYVDFEEIK